MTKRPLWIIAVLLVGAAAALWGATGLSWLATPDLPPDHRTGLGTGGVGGTGLGTGGTGGPSFTALALLALAGLLGMFAVGGWLRRVLGAIIVVAGGYVCWQAFATAGAKDMFTGRGLALLGGVLLVAAGLLVIRHASTLPTMGSRYQLASTERRSGDADKDLWDGLSNGEDPTSEQP
jgi:Tryptophan-associated transmembrane protein (Trp_oprn_chp)